MLVGLKINKIYNMSRIEELMTSAYKLGREKQMFDSVDKLKSQNPKMGQTEIYEKAYSITFNTD